MKRIKNFINGEFIEAAGGRLFDKRSPLDNQVIAQVSEAGRPEVEAAVAAGRAALEGEWGRITVAERVELLYGVANEINRRFDDFLSAEVADTGKPRSLASHLDIPRGAANFKIFADVVKNVPSEFFEMATPDGRGAINYAVRRPVGVVGVVCPWNLPLLLMTWKVGPALACGNAVVVKPSEETPQTATLLGEVMNAVGIPRGVYNVVHGFGPGSAGEFLTTHPGVNAITFTGETRTGAAIMRAASDGARPVSLEMGGKNPAIVFADADLDAAIEGTLRSCFANCGQVCLGTERVYVERPLFETFVARLKQGAESLVIGQQWPPGDASDVRVVLFVKLREGGALDEALIDRIRRTIRDNTTPRHVPAKIVQVTDIPRTKSGKVVELAVRSVVHGEAVKNAEALANPAALDQFRARPELQS